MHVVITSDQWVQMFTRVSSQGSHPLHYPFIMEGMETVYIAEWTCQLWQNMFWIKDTHNSYNKQEQQKTETALNLMSGAAVNVFWLTEQHFKNFLELHCCLFHMTNVL